MALLYDLQTELGAVNEMLASISSSPVDRLVGDEVPPDATAAHKVLLDTMRSFQNSPEGWYWNTETMDLQPAVPSGEVLIPLNTLKVAACDPRYVARGNRLYDTKDHTYAIGRAVTVTLTFLLGFEDMPNAAREFVALKAKRVFQANEQGNNATISRPDEDELRAFAAVLNEHAEVIQANVVGGWHSVRADFRGAFR
ncbi:hypothetical protein [Inquilinus limosus]|uniref:hypothetical protein n=1 Tax=Inquilinus limosus TaxID=171674 RepID=UPI00047B15C6|nr:hypothetical protein [Inquilinus limosus]